MPCQGSQLVGATRHSLSGTVAERHARVETPVSCSDNSSFFPSTSPLPAQAEALSLLCLLALLYTL
jgi:hypothetical protein